MQLDHNLPDEVIINNLNTTQLYSGADLGRRADAIFLVKIFQKVLENAFLAYFFKNLPTAQKILPK